MDASRDVFFFFIWCARTGELGVLQAPDKDEDQRVRRASLGIWGWDLYDKAFPYGSRTELQKVRVQGSPRTRVERRSIGITTRGFEIPTRFLLEVGSYRTQPRRLPRADRV